MDESMNFAWQALPYIAGLLGLIAGAWALWRSSAFTAAEKANEQLQIGLTGAMARIDTLEGEVRDLEAKREEDREKIAKLEAMVTAKQQAMDDILRAAVNSGGCDIAFKCKRRVVPGQGGEKE